MECKQLPVIWELTYPNRLWCIWELYVLFALADGEPSVKVLQLSSESASERLRDFGTVCDIAAERGLQLDVTFFTGHMSGPNWSPRWLLDKDAPAPSPFMRQVLSEGKVVDSSYRNMFHDEEALAASRLLLRTVVSEYKDHDAIWMWNLGNEPDLFAWPHSAQAGQQWVREMRSLIREVDPVHDVTCGLHSANLLMDNGLNVDKVFAETDVPVMHGYPMYVASRH